MSNDFQNRLLTVFERSFSRRFSNTDIRAKKLEEWDSLSHVNLVIALEQEFAISFDPEEVAGLYSDFDTVLRMVMEKQG